MGRGREFDHHNASTQSQMDNFIERRLGNVESTVSIFRQENSQTTHKLDRKDLDPEDRMAETNTEISFC